MRNYITVLITALVLFTFALACSNSSNNSNNFQNSSNNNSAITTPSPKLDVEKNKEEQSFSFAVQDGKEIKASVFPDKTKSQGKMIVFTPLLDKTDGNLYNASLNSLWNVYGKKRGLFQLADAKTEFDNELGGNAICWDISNPKQKFCVFPTKDSETNGIGALQVWIK